MGYDFSGLKPGEIKTISYVENNFRYDDTQKGEKLYLNLINSGRITTDEAWKFVYKFGEYIENGRVGAMCPYCGAFSEGRRKILCRDCSESVEQLRKKYERLAKANGGARQAPQYKKPVVKAVPEPEEDEALEENAEEELIVFPKKTFYKIVAAALMLAFAVNVLVAVVGVTTTKSRYEERLAQIEDTQVPTVHE